jgi:hypothetical protein
MAAEIAVDLPLKAGILRRCVLSRALVQLCDSSIEEREDLPWLDQQGSFWQIRIFAVCQARASMILSGLPSLRPSHDPRPAAALPRERDGSKRISLD